MIPTRRTSRTGLTVPPPVDACSQQQGVAREVPVDHFGKHIEQLGSAEWQVRHAAFHALRKRGPEALPAINTGLADPRWRVRRGCADLLDHLAGEGSAEPLVALLQDEVAAV